MQVANAPEDDPSIGDAAPLWRRIHPNWVLYDENLGRQRPTSQAFQNQVGSESFSVFLGDMITGRGDGPDAILAGHDGYHVAAVTAGLARHYRQRVSHDPTAEEDAHGQVSGLKPSSIKSRFARQAVWIVAP